MDKARIPTAPEGYHTLNPILRLPDAAAGLAFYRDAFGAAEDFRREADGRLLVAVILIGDSRLMLWDASNDPEKPAGGAAASGLELKIYVDDVDAVFRRAIDLGARTDEAVETRYFGERTGSIVDPFGFRWRLSQFLEQIPHAEIERRMHEDLGR